MQPHVEMKGSMRRHIGIMLGILAIVLAACEHVNDVNQIKLKGSGNIVEQTYTLANFDRVDASQTFKVTITPGEPFSVIVRADDNVQPYLDVRVQGSNLWLGLDNKHNYNLSNVTLQADVTMPELVYISASGTSSVTANGFVTDQAFTARASGASSIMLDVEAGAMTFEASGGSAISGTCVAAGGVQMDASGESHLALTGSGGGTLTLDLSGGSQFNGMINIPGDVTLNASGISLIMLTGSGGTLALETSGGSRAFLDGFSATDGTVSASGDSQVAVNLNGTLNATVSGTSTVTYRGAVTLGTIEQSTGSTLAAAE